MLKSSLTAAALMAMASSAEASTVTSTLFDFRAVIGTEEPQAFVSAGSEAGFCDPLDGTGCDGGVDRDGSSVFVDWVDGDSFDIGFSGAPQSSFSVVLTGVAFTGGAEVTDLSFNLGGGDPANNLNIDDFLFDPINNPTAPDAPTISTDVFFNSAAGTNNLFISFEDVDGLLWGDGPTARFDVTIAGNPAVIPLPAGLALLLTGMAGFAGLGRSRRKA